MVDNRRAASVLSVFAVVVIIVVTVVIMTGVGLYYKDVVTDGTPQAVLSFEYDEDSETLVVGFDGGETLEGNRVVFRTADGEILGTWGSEGEVRAGAVKELEGVQPDDTVEVIYTHPVDDQRSVLAVWND